MARTSGGPSWATTWTDMPDPVTGGTTTILVDEAFLRHTYADHVSQPLDRPCWLEFVGALLLTRFDGWVSAPTSDSAFPDAFAALARGHVENGLARPCVVIYDQFGTRGTLLHQTVEVVTPSGLIAILRRAGSGYRLQTVFFPFEAAREPPQRRWLEAVRSRIELYTRQFVVQGRQVVAHPEPQDRFPSSEPEGFRARVRFESRKVWGFRDIDIEGDFLSVWKAPLPWPSPGTPSPNPLKKRKQ